MGGSDKNKGDPDCMDRPRRAATKVTNFRSYHLSGDLDNQVQGLVESRIEQFDMASTDELKQQLEQERENNKKLEQDAEYARIQHELEIEKLKKEQWQAAMDRLKQAREKVQQDHDRHMAEIERVGATTTEEEDSTSLTWLKAQMARLEPAPTEEQVRARKAREEKEAAIQELKAQQEELA